MQWKNIQHNIYICIISLIIIFGISIRVLAFLNNNYSVPIDECHSLIGIQASYKNLLTNFVQGSNFLPFYKFILKFIHQIFGFNFVMLKTPALIAGIFSVLVFYKVLAKLFTNKIIIIAALVIFCLSYNLIFYSTAIKPYEADALFTLIIIYAAICFNEKYKDKQIPNKTIIIYSFISVLLCFLSIPAIVLTELYWGIIFLNYLLKCKSKPEGVTRLNPIKNPNIIRLLIFQGITISFIILEYFLYIRQMGSDNGLKNQWLTNGFFFKPDSLDAINSLIYFSNFSFYWFDKDLTLRLEDSVIILFILIFITGCIKFIIPSLKKCNTELNINGLFIVTPVLFFILLSFLNIYPFCNRCIIFLIPIFIIIFFNTFDFKNNKIVSGIFNIIVLIILYLFIAKVDNLGNLSPLLFDYSGTQFEKNNITRLENVNHENIIISMDVVCMECLNNNNIVFLNKYESKITPENVDLFFFDKRTQMHYRYESIKDIIKDKKNVYFTYSVIDDYNNAIPIIEKLIEQEGYKKEEEIRNVPFAEFSVYKKKE